MSMTQILAAAQGAAPSPAQAAAAAIPARVSSADQIFWVSSLVFGFPLAMLLLGDAIRWLQRRRLPYAPALGNLRNLLLPSLALLVLLTIFFQLKSGGVFLNSTNLQGMLSNMEANAETIAEERRLLKKLLLAYIEEKG
jgi:hypothetical protein